MRTQKFASLILALLFLCSLAIAQTQPSDPDPEKEKKTKEQNERIMQLLDQAIGDAATLRLPQNRAMVYAISGDLYWKFDEKRARELFRNAAAEVIISNQESEKEKLEGNNPFAEMIDLGRDVRAEILPLVAKHDAEMALELLLQTRSPKLAEAMARASLPGAKAADGDMMNFNPERIKISQELALEQQFALLAANENPDKAIKMIKDSLAKGVSPNVMPLLQKLQKKDEKKATELGGEVIKKLVDSDLAKNEEEMRTALAFLQQAFKPPPPPANAKDKQFAFTEAQIKELANKMAATLLQPSKSLTIAMLISQAMPMIEKFAPDKVILLKQRQAENDANMPPEFKRMTDQQKLWDSNSTPEDILTQYPKLNEFEKMTANQSLLNKIGQIEDEARAKKLIDQIPDEKTRTSALEQFEANRIGRSASAGKLDDARKMIGNLTKKKTQIQRLVALAMDFHRKGGEKEVATAKVLMKDAKALTNEYAETNDDIADVMEVVKGYTLIDLETAFQMFEPMIDKINEYVQASSVLSRFNPQNNTTFRKGEMVMRGSANSYDSPLFRCIPHIQALGKADMERMNLLTDRFARTDSRTIVKLYMLQGISGG